MLFAMFACAANPSAEAAPGLTLDPDAFAVVPTPGTNQEVAIFAGGCFWCLESDFDKLAGVIATTSGYAGGRVPNPTYEQVGAKVTGHFEAVHVIYDTKVLDYATVLDYFWRHIDPIDPNGQFCDKGEPYRTGIYPRTNAQDALAGPSKAAVETLLGKPVATKIFPVGTPFYAAENYHQDFHITTPGRYSSYRLGCGRDAKVSLIWAGK